MAKDYLTELQYLGLISRIKRLSDATIISGRNLYQYIDIGIEPNWFLIFRIIVEKGQTSVSEISSTLKFSHPSVISIVKKMDKAGYLHITAHPVDKRRQIIRLSKKASKQMPEMEKVWDACEKAVASLFVNDTFLKELQKMEDALEEKSFFDRVLHFLNIDDVILEPFKKGDARSFSQLNRRWLEEFFSVEPQDVIVFKNPQKHIIKPGGQITMAKVKGKSVGTVALVHIDNRQTELSRMAVDPNFQRRGIGKSLIEEAIAQAKKMSYECIILYSNTALKPAIKLYKKLGFKKVPIEKDIGYQRANIKMKLKLSNV